MFPFANCFTVFLLSFQVSLLMYSLKKKKKPINPSRNEHTTYEDDVEDGRGSSMGGGGGSGGGRWSSSGAVRSATLGRRGVSSGPTPGNGGGNGAVNRYRSPSIGRTPAPRGASRKYNSLLNLSGKKRPQGPPDLGCGSKSAPGSVWSTVEQRGGDWLDVSMSGSGVGTVHGFPWQFSYFFGTHMVVVGGVWR